MTRDLTESASQAVKQNRATVLRDQQRSFHALLRYVWQKSRFYRDLYSSAGIREHELADMAPKDLPIIGKKLLMENFDRAVTDPRLKKTDLQRWVHEYRNPAANYRQDFIVFHSSGSSGTKGIFVCTQSDWQFAASAMAGRLPLPVNYPIGKTKAAFYLVSYGNFSGVSVAARMPKTVYELLVLSVVESHQHTVKQLNEFQPHQLHGYASSIHELSQLAMMGKLHISPKRIFVGGDKLTKNMEEDIGRAWAAPIYDLYSASESTYIAYRQSGEHEMGVTEELNILEVLDEANRSVAENQQGRAVLTNLYNYAFPLIRYELGDFVTLGEAKLDSPLKTVKDIGGRVSDHLPVTLHDGRPDTINHIALSVFYVPGLEKVQFVSVRPDLVHILYVSAENLDSSIRCEFERVLALRGAAKTTFAVCRVARIASDPQTGKFHLVRIQHPPTATQTEELPVEGIDILLSRRTAVRSLEPQATRLENHQRTASFREFTKEHAEQSINARFEQQVAQYPDQVAVKTKNQSWTYRQLNDRANQIAHAILNSGVDQGKPIALLFEHDVMMIAALLGVLKAGKAYVALEPSHPTDRLAYFVADSQAEAIITNNQHRMLASELTYGALPVVNVDEIGASIPTSNLSIAVAPDDLVYILYTSGSTGRPKGVYQNQRGVLHFVRIYTNYLRLNAKDRLTLFSSYAYDAAVVDIFAALLNGTTLHPWDVREQGLTDIFGWMTRNNITIYHSTPTLFESLVATPTQEDAVTSIRVVVLGGEPVSKKHVSGYRRCFNQCSLVNLYGSSESSINLLHTYNHQNDEERDFLPIGCPVEDTEVLLLNDACEHEEFSGEIAIKSPHVALGYWHKPELTDKVFFTDSDRGKTRIYRTGDMGRLLANGNMEFVGRKDFQVKIRGYRVQPEEIADVLREHSLVRDSVIAGRRDDAGQLQVIAYVVMPPDLVPSSHELRAFLNMKLPDYMIPSFFVFLDTLPLTPNCKVDWCALPVPDHTQPALDRALVAPRTLMEEEVAKIWVDVLGVQQVGVHDNFFELGGHSLKATQIMSRLRGALQVDLPLRAIFETPTVEGLAEVFTWRQIEEAEEEDVVRLVAELEALSDEAAQHLLTKEALREKRN